jgi:quercetin dioxygenase-like cupin family protein
MVVFAPGEGHWHGALPDRFMAHLALQKAIAATALRTGAVLVTEDERLRAYPGVATIWD